MKIDILSQGFVSGNKAHIKIDGTDRLGKAGRGINLVVMVGGEIKSRSYDTYGGKKHSDRLVKDLKEIPEGAVIIAAVRDEASRKLTPALKAAFAELGSKEIKNLRFREGWIFVAAKGGEVYGEKRGKSVNLSFTMEIQEETEEQSKI